MDVQELRKKNTTALQKLLQEKKQEAQSIYCDLKVKQEKNHKDYRGARRSIAMISTVINEKNNSKVNNVDK